MSFYMHPNMLYILPNLAIILAVMNQTRKGEIFFLSDDNNYPMEEIVDIVAQEIEVVACCTHLPMQ